MTEEARTLKRWHPIYYLRVADRKTNKMIGRVVDITTEGIRLVSDKPIKIDKTYRLKMNLPSVRKSGMEINFDASSVWSSKDINPDFFSTGFQMIRLSEKARQEIEYLIRDISFQN